MKEQFSIFLNFFKFFQTLWQYFFILTFFNKLKLSEIKLGNKHPIDAIFRESNFRNESCPTFYQFWFFHLIFPWKCNCSPILNFLANKRKMMKLNQNLSSTNSLYFCDMYTKSKILTEEISKNWNHKTFPH